MADETDAPQPETVTAPAPPAPQPLPAMGDEGATEEWSPPQRLDDGTPVDGYGLPINLRLRKAALADGGKDEDPAGVVSAEDIAAEAERLADFDAEYPKTAGLKTAELEKLAKAEDVDISTAGTNEERAALIDAARPSRI